MKPFLIFTFFLFIGTFGFSQDVILKKNGKKIEAKVLEVSSTQIKYKREDQLDGPLRTIPVYDVKEIIYEDGTWDTFEQESPKETPKNETVLREPRAKAKDPLFDSGTFLDLILGYARTTEENICSQCGPFDPITGPTDLYFVSPRNYFTLNIKLGHKFYIGSKDKMWRPGIQANWMRLGINVDFNDPSTIITGPKNLSLANVGMANVFKFTDDIGLELNFTTGFNFDIDINNGGILTYGIGFAPELKFRYKSLAVGLDYLRIQGFALSANNGYVFDNYTNRNWNIVGLSVGAKF
jgi:hypothetical protein